jgi:hypothetical protein
MNRSALRYGIAQKCHGGTIEIATIKARKLPNVYSVKTRAARNDCALVEVPRSNRQVAEQRREIGQAMRDHVQHIPFALQFPAHQE